MKKLLITTLLFAGLVAFVPTASASHKKKKNHCDRSDYYQSYQPSYRYYEEQPVYYRPAPVVRYRSYGYDDCRPSYRQHQRSSLSFGFGF